MTSTLSPFHKRLVLHIGTHKTGTTAIQHAMEEHRDFLRSRDVEPVNANSIRHLMEVFFPARYRMSFEDVDIERHKETFLEWARAVSADTIVVSSEHMTRVARSWQPLAERAATMFGQFERIDVVVYVRRQDLILESMFQEDLKGANSKSASIADYMREHRDPSRLDYHLEIGRYRTSLPHARIIPRLYSDAVAAKDIFHHFLETIGVDDVPPAIGAKKVNVSLDEVGCTIIALAGLNRQARRELHDLLRTKYTEHVKAPGRQLRFLSREQRQEIIDRYHESNRRLFEEYELGSVEDLRQWEHVQEDAEALPPNELRRRAVAFLAQCLLTSERNARGGTEESE